MAYTLGEAAKATGKSKSTLSKAIKTGKFSASKGLDGSFHIDPSELHRVYPPVSNETGNTASNSTPSNTQETARIKELEALLSAAENRVRDRDETLSELREDRDHWRRQATSLLEDNRRAVALIESERKKDLLVERPATEEKPKGFLQKLLGR